MATGTRLRFNLSKGRIGAALTTGDTTVNLGEVPDWPTLAEGEYIALTLSDSEIVHATAYTAGDNTCTVERAQEGTTAIGHSSGAPWVLGATSLDFDHGELADLGADTHTAYPTVTGSRGFSGEVAGVTPTQPASLATKGYVDSVATISSARWRRLTTQVVASGVVSTVTFATGAAHDLDPDDDWSMDTATGLLTINVAGRYEVSAGVGWEANADGSRAARILRSSGAVDTEIGALYQRAAPTGPTAGTLSSGPVTLADGDVVRVDVEQDAGVDVNLQGSEAAPRTWLTIKRVR